MGAPQQAGRAALQGQRAVRVFVTVGSMLPFDRLIAAVDTWARAHPDALVVAQTGDGAMIPTAMEYHTMLPPARYRQYCADADVIVSHVGMGTVITAAEVRRPLVALPRRRELGEVTSDHQLATANWVRKRQGVIVIDSEAELGKAIAEAHRSADLQKFAEVSQVQLVECLRAFISDAVRRRY